MCQYRYYYYASCRHQQTVLFNFCDKATPIPPSASAPDARRNAPARVREGQAQTPKKEKKSHSQKRESTTESSKKPTGWSKKGKKGKQGKQQTEARKQQQHGAASGATSKQKEKSSHASSAARPPHKQHSSSSPSIGSASITEGLPKLHTSSPSLLQQIRTQQHSSAAVASPEDMAGLRPFGQAFRHWVGGGPGQQTCDTDGLGIHHEDATSEPLTASARRRQPGIRECTDESFDMPNSADILQHVAESCRDVQGQHIGTDLYRMPSYGSTNAGDQDYQKVPALPDSYEAIEADLNRLKKEVVQLKQRESREGSTASGVEEESAAARLQKAHDRLKDTVRAPRPEQLNAPALPSQNDFPALGSAKSSKSSSSSATDTTLSTKQAERKASYASAATVGMKDAIDKAFSTSRGKRADSKLQDAFSDGPLSATSANSFGSTMQHAATLTTSQTSSSAGARRSFEYEDEEGSVIVSPQSAMTDGSGPTVVSNGTQSSPNGRSEKDAPRFAQPTQSFARHAGEALRKDSISAGAKQAGADTSPTKRLNKRKSIPGDWLGARSPQKGHANADPTSSPVYSSPMSNGDWQLVDRVVAKEASIATKSSEPQLRKKKSSYMSPTAATTQRTIATLGEENAKRKPGTLRVNTTHANQYTSLSSPDSNALSSANLLPSSVTDRIEFGSSISPPSPRRQAQRTIDAILAKGSVPLSPRDVTQGNAVKKTSESPKSPSKIPRARKTLASHLQELSVNSANGAGRAGPPSPLDAVANTTTKRRTSHADILKPIFDKLDSQGLRKGNADPLHVSHDKAGESRVSSRHNVRRPVYDLLHETPRKPSPGLEDIALLARQGVGMKKTVLPPHLRASRQSSVASNGSDAAPAVHAPSQSSSIPAPAPQLLSLQSASAQDDTVFGRDQTPANGQSAAASTQKPSPATALRAAFGSEQTSSRLQPAPELLPGPSPASSLRATAPNFTPLWQPQNPVQELRLLSWQGMLDHKPDEQWSPLPVQVKDCIQTLREYKAYGQVPARTFPSRSQSPSKRQEQRFWGSLMAMSGSSGAVLPSENTHAGTAICDRDGNVAMPDAGAEATVKTTSPNGVQVGQVLKPALSPGKKSVKWTLQDTDGQEKPVTFGRAPAPIMTATEDTVTGETPLVSPTSDDTSPIKTPHSAHGAHAWTIGSNGFTPGYYGWKGGDGKEISFTGYGPNAERDPNSAVNMQFFNGRPGAFAASPPSAGMGSLADGSRENSSPTPKVWPKSMRQWAELAGYNKVPCGSMEITDAVEQSPFASPTFGYCNDCVPAGY
ncbi:hypothetical protein LTR85_003462 [Meristemomyces frigidus]|nr:hypothetical protein LTR85_003462 [Meristemomyces frigidus]